MPAIIHNIAELSSTLLSNTGPLLHACTRQCTQQIMHDMAAKTNYKSPPVTCWPSLNKIFNITVAMLNTGPHRTILGSTEAVGAYWEYLINDYHYHVLLP